MQVIKSGKFYKASRITGPVHNFLALAFISNGDSRRVQIEKLPAGGANSRVSNLDSERVVEKVLEGVSQANAELGTDYRVEIMQYVPSDSADLDAYLQLAKRITQEAAKAAGESAADPQDSAIA